MAREYKLEIQRDGVNAVLYYHDDNTIELTDPDSGVHIDYLQTKLSITQEMIGWMRKHGVLTLECNKV